MRSHNLLINRKIGPLVVIVGPTASGKTALGMELAMKLNGEIICADSRTVYKGLDIGTAKPTVAEQKAVQHHLLDVVEPDQYFSAADFKTLANKAINAIIAKEKLPIMIGGSGLYIDSVIFNYSFANADSAAWRDSVNPRHLSRAVAVSKDVLRANTIVIGLEVSKNELRRRISERVDFMFASGLIEETETIVKKYGWEIRPLKAPGYKAVRRYRAGGISLDTAKKEFIKNDLDLAKRQMAWFRRNKSIQWQNDFCKIVEIATTFLNKTH